MPNSHQPVHLGRTVPLKHDRRGRPLLVEMPKRVEAMERASCDLFMAMSHLSVLQLKGLRRLGDPRLIPLIDALVSVRECMGGEGSV